MFEAYGEHVLSVVEPCLQILVLKTREEACQQNENKWNESCGDVLEPSCSKEMIGDFYLLFENENEVI